MSSRLTQTQLSQVVTEVTRLAHQREELERSTLERAEVERILRELDLPAELLDDAMVELERRELVAQQKRSKNRIVMAVAAVVLVLVLGVGWIFYLQSAALGRVNADPGQITLGANDAQAVQVINKQANREVFNQVVLRDAPEGKELNLKCKWYDPTGKVYRENTYRTKTIDKSVWPTHCKCQLGSDAASGTWKVELSLEGRVISTTTFKVE